MNSPLQELLNISFEKGVFLNALKLANIILVIKNEDSMQCNNYRPQTSLTFNIKKIMEKLFHQLLYFSLKKNKILHDD